nr:hypothetical protein [Streptomyces roseicoloratus]
MAGFTRPVASPHAMASTEWVPAVPRPTAMTAEQKPHPHLAIFAYVQGVGPADEFEERARRETGVSGDERREKNEPRCDAIQSSGSHALPLPLSEEGDFRLDLESLFEFGLRRTPDGIAAMIGETSA